MMDNISVCLILLCAIVQVTSRQSNCTNYYIVMEETVLGTQYFLEPLAANQIHWEEFSDADEIANCLIELGCLGMETTCETHYDIKPKYGPDEHVDTNSSWSFPFAWFSSRVPTTTSSTTTIDSMLFITEFCSLNMVDFISFNQCTEIPNFINNSNAYLYECQITERNECKDAITESEFTSVNNSKSSEFKCTNYYVIFTESLVNNYNLEPFKMNEIIDWRSIININETSCYLEVDCSGTTSSCVKAHNIKQLYENRKHDKEANGLITNDENSNNVTMTLENSNISFATLSPHTIIFETQTPGDEWLVYNEVLNNSDMTTEETINEKSIENMKLPQNNTELDEKTKTDNTNKVTQEDLTVNIDNPNENCTFLLYLCDKIANLSQNSTYIKCKYFEEICTNKLTSTLKTSNSKLTDSENTVINKITTNSTYTTQTNNLTDFEKKELQGLGHTHLMDKQNNRETNESTKTIEEQFKEFPDKTEKILNDTNERAFSTTTTINNNSITSTEITQFDTSTKFTDHESTETQIVTRIETSTEFTQIEISTELNQNETSGELTENDTFNEFTQFETTTHKKSSEMAERNKERNENNGQTGASSKERDDYRTGQIFFTVTGAVVSGTILYFIATKIRDFLKSGQYRISEDQTVNQECIERTSEI